MTKVFLNFPLCLLSKEQDKVKLINLILNYCLVEKALSYEEDYEPTEEQITDFEENYKSYNPSNSLHNRMIKALDFFEFTLGNFNFTITQYYDAKKYINNFEEKNGKDSYAAIGLDLVWDCLGKGFGLEHFKILCAINSILGKRKKYVRITLDRIRYAMHGYRSKAVYNKSNHRSTKMLLSDKQLKNRIDFLNNKKFFSRFTYARRQTFYSTQIKSNEALIEAVKNYKVFRAKRKLGIEDKLGTDLIKIELERIKELRTKRLDAEDNFVTHVTYN